MRSGAAQLRRSAPDCFVHRDRRPPPRDRLRVSDDGSWLGHHPGIDVGTGVEQQAHRREDTFVGAIPSARHSRPEFDTRGRHQGA